jgi:hypothetical protein
VPLVSRFIQRQSWIGLRYGIHADAEDFLRDQIAALSWQRHIRRYTVL